MAVNAAFFALYIYEEQWNDSNRISSFSINDNKLAFALEDTAIEKVNVDNYNVPVYVSSAPNKSGTDIFKPESYSTAPTLHSIANSLYNAALHLGHQEDHQYQYQYQHQIQLQPEQQQMHQLLTTGTGDYYNNEKAAHIKLASTMAATSPSSPPILGNPPILNVPGDNYVEATSSSGTHVNFIVTATAGPPNSGTVDMDTQRQQQQLRQIPLSPVCSPPSGSLFPIGVTTVICSVSDRYSPSSNGGGGSSSSGSISSNAKPVTKSFKIVVGDTASPALSLPADGLSVKATSKTTAVSYSEYLSALDIVDGRITPICSPPSGSLFPIGMAMVSCSAIDRHGNTATGTFGITVRYPVFGGFVEPVDPGGSSVFKLGSTIPIRFQLKWPDGQPVTDAKVQIFNAKISDRIIGAESGGSGSISKENDVVPPSPGNYFGYDSSTGLYTFYLGTGNLSPGIWQIKVVLDDGSTHALKISLIN